jgi:hypothetical protein
MILSWRRLMETSDHEYLLDVLQERVDDVVLNICKELGLKANEVEFRLYGNAEAMHLSTSDEELVDETR